MINNPNSETTVKKRQDPKKQRRSPIPRHENEEIVARETETGEESNENTKVRRSPRLREKLVQKLVEETLIKRSEEDGDGKCHLSEDDLSVIKDFRKNFAVTFTLI